MILVPSTLFSACQRTAYHEAGHAAAVVLSSGAFWRRGISLRPRGGHTPERYRHSGAHLTIDPPARARNLLGPEQRTRAEALLVIVMAGVVTERTFLGRPPRDHAFRQELACHGLYPLLHVHGGACLPEYRRWLQARAVHLVACHWRGISRLAAALMEAQDLTGQEAARLIRGQG